MSIAVAQSETTDTETKDAFAGLGRWDWQTVLPFVAAATLLAILAWPTIHFWCYEYAVPESYYQHAPLIPLIVGLMLWHRREALQAVPKKPALIALLLLVPALALLVFAIKLPAEALESAAFLLSIVGSVWLTLGTAVVRTAAFPLAFLWLMAPLPRPLLNDATLHVQMASTILADKLLHLMTFHTSLVGNVIHMENYSLFVGRAVFRLQAAARPADFQRGVRLFGGRNAGPSSCFVSVQPAAELDRQQCSDCFDRCGGGMYWPGSRPHLP